MNIAIYILDSEREWKTDIFAPYVDLVTVDDNIGYEQLLNEHKASSEDYVLVLAHMGDAAALLGEDACSAFEALKDRLFLIFYSTTTITEERDNWAFSLGCDPSEAVYFLQHGISYKDQDKLDALARRLVEVINTIRNKEKINWSRLEPSPCPENLVATLLLDSAMLILDGEMNGMLDSAGVDIWEGIRSNAQREYTERINFGGSLPDDWSAHGERKELIRDVLATRAGKDSS